MDAAAFQPKARWGLHSPWRRVIRNLANCLTHVKPLGAQFSRLVFANVAPRYLVVRPVRPAAKKAASTKPMRP